MGFTISGIQQVGVGVNNVYQAWDWYRENFGFDVLLSDAPGAAIFMQTYTDHRPQTRHTILAYNMQGGGGLEIWQYTSRKPTPAEFEVKLGDLGTFAAKLKSSNVAAAYLKMKAAGLNICSKFCKDPAGQDHFFVKDLYDNVFEIVGCDNVFRETNSKIGGVYGAIVGVSDMENAIEFYGSILGYDTVLYDQTGTFDDFENIPGGTENQLKQEFRRVLLSHSQPRKGPFSNFLGQSQIELVQVLTRKPNKIYDFKKHLWGDPGFIQICFDIRNMKDLKQFVESKGLKFTADSNPEAYEGQAEIFDMGGASGHFTYIEDPDQNLIEFVETNYVPIIEKFGIGLNLKKKDPEKPLPNFLVAGLRFLRKDENYSNSKTAKEKTEQAEEALKQLNAQLEKQNSENETNK